MQNSFDYFSEIADWGANIVRFPVHPRAWRNRKPGNYLQLLDKGIELARAYDLYVIIDWHSIGNLKEEKFQHRMYDTTVKETIEFWQTIAQRYKDEPVVAMYEIYNEPTVSGDQFGDMTWPEWKQLQERIIGAIRKIDSETIVLCAGFNWAYGLTPIKENPIDAVNIAYVSHPYPQKREKPWEEKWQADWGFAADTYPVILTEIGFCLKDERGAHVPVISDVSYGKAITAYTEKKGVSWVVWVFDADWSPMLIRDKAFTPTTQGKFFKTALQSRNP
ncbi:MAG: cellulase family glycosylhydrolase [candidate division KSB1 bacterium]|nr:cellulase family glycosylhydrolase [candidate division KSB1 bacterium]